MLTHVFRTSVATAVVLLFTALPYLPGPYDSFAVLLSGLAHLFGFVSLLLVPVGAVWTLSRFSTALVARQHVFASAALIALSVVWWVTSFAAVAIGSFSLGLCGFAARMYTARRSWPRVKLLRRPQTEYSSALPLFLVTVPVAVLLLQLALARPLTESARDRAIRNAAPLIAAIEEYRVAHGRYPVSLLSVWPDFQPSVIGVAEYRYEPRGDAYNLFFEKPNFRLGTREFVMYNPLDQHALTSHRIDILELTDEQLALDQSRGHNALNATKHPHWKYYWFD